MTFAYWSVFGFVVSLAAVGVVMRGRVGRELRIGGAAMRMYFGLVVAAGVTQFCSIVVLRGFQVGYALALFQTSTLISVLLGYKVFKERNILERLIGSVVMIGGAVLIVVEGGR